jgi:hypothetical protein
MTMSKTKYYVAELPQLTRRVSCKYLQAQAKAIGSPKLYIELHVIYPPSYSLTFHFPQPHSDNPTLPLQHRPESNTIAIQVLYNRLHSYRTNSNSVPLTSTHQYRNTTQRSFLQRRSFRNQGFCKKITNSSCQEQLLAVHFLPTLGL